MSKKTIKRNKRDKRDKRSKKTKNRRGGFFGMFKSKHNELDKACNINELVNLKKSNEMHANYEQCCPKGFFGKNSSPYCKQLDLNYKATVTQENNARGFDSDDDNLRPSDVAHLEGALYQHNTVGPNQINCKDENYPNLLTSEDKIEEYIQTCECNKSRLNPFSNKRKNCDVVIRKKKYNEDMALNNKNRQQKLDSLRVFIQRFPPNNYSFPPNNYNYTKEDLKKYGPTKKMVDILNKKLDDFIYNFPREDFNYTEEELRKVGPRNMVERFKAQFIEQYPPDNNQYTIEELNSNPEKVMNDMYYYEKAKKQSNPYSMTDSETDDETDDDEDDEIMGYREMKQNPQYYRTGGKRKTKKYLKKSNRKSRKH